MNPQQHVLDEVSINKQNYFKDFDSLYKVTLLLWLNKAFGSNWKSLFEQRLILTIIEYLTLNVDEKQQEWDEFAKYITFCPKVVKLIPIFMDDSSDQIRLRMILDFNVSYDFYTEQGHMIDDVVESIEKDSRMKEIDVNFFYKVSSMDQELRDQELIEIKRSGIIGDTFKPSEFVDRFHGNSVVIFNKNLNEIDTFESRVEFISGDNRHFEHLYKKFTVKNVVLYINTHKYENLDFDGIAGENVYQNFGTAEWNPDNVVWDQYGPQGPVKRVGMVLRSDYMSSKNILVVSNGRRGDRHALDGCVESTDVMMVNVKKENRSEFNEEISQIDLLFKRKETDLVHQSLKLKSGAFNQYYGIQCNRCGGLCNKGAPIIMVTIKIWKEW